MTVSSSVSPILPPPARTLSATPVGQQPAQRLALLLPVDDRLVQEPEPAQRAGSPGPGLLGQREEELLDRLAIAAGVVCSATRDRLDRPALGHVLAAAAPARRSSPPRARHRRDDRLDDRRVEHRAAGRDLAHGPRELVALGDAVLQQVGVAGGAVGQQRDRVLGVVVLGEHHDAGARVALRSSFAASMPSCWKLGGMRMSVTSTWGAASVGAGEQLVVVAGDADDLEVGLDRQQRAHALADDHVVVGQEHGDPHVVQHHRSAAGTGKVVRARSGGGAATPRRRRGWPPSRRPAVTRTVGSTLGGRSGHADRVVDHLVSWIPSEAVTGLNKGIFESGFTHYDDPPPDLIDDLDALRDADGFRFANHLAVWIEVEDGRVVALRSRAAAG